MPSKVMSNERFNDLLSSVKEAVAISKGDLKAARVTSLEKPEALQIRQDLGLSRTEFSKVLGVSVRTLEGWEQGRREPQGAAKMLLKVASKHPDIVLEVAKH